MTSHSVRMSQPPAEAAAGTHDVRMSWGTAFAAVVAALAVVTLAMYQFSRSTLGDLTHEDGVVEYGTSLAYFAAAAVLLAVAVRRREGRLWSALLALGFFFIAGEEISWGQRLFGVAPPESLAQHNVQRELNLHNYEGLNDSVRLLGTAAFLGLYLVVPIAQRMSDGVRRLVDRLHFPVPPLWIGAVAAIAFALELVAKTRPGLPIFAFNEVGELFFGCAAVAFGLVLWAGRGREDTPVA